MGRYWIVMHEEEKWSIGILKSSVQPGRSPLAEEACMTFRTPCVQNDAGTGAERKDRLNVTICIRQVRKRFEKCWSVVMIADRQMHRDRNINDALFQVLIVTTLAPVG